MKDLFVSDIEAEGDFSIIGQIISQAMSMAPLIVANTLLNINFNADYLDGYHASAFPRKAEAATISAVWNFTDPPLVTNPGTNPNNVATYGQLTALDGTFNSKFDARLATKTTSSLAEGSNLYFTQARVLATPLTAYAVGANTALAATDTILGAFQKVQGQLNAKAATLSGTSGFFAKFTSGSTIGNSIMSENGNQVVIGANDTNSKSLLLRNFTEYWNLELSTAVISYTAANPAILVTHGAGSAPFNQYGKLIFFGRAADGANGGISFYCGADRGLAFDISANKIITISNQLVSTLANGTAAFSVTSTTLNPNLNSDYLDDQHGSYYLSRANHTGSQAISTITGLQTALDAKITFSSWNNNALPKMTGATTLAPSIVSENGSQLIVGANDTSAKSFLLRNQTAYYQFDIGTAVTSYAGTNPAILIAHGAGSAPFNNYGKLLFFARAADGTNGGMAFHTGLDQGVALNIHTDKVVTVYRQFVSTLATGTAPFSIASTTRVPNLNSDYLDDQHGSYYLSRANHTGSQAWSTITGTPTTISGYGITDILAQVLTGYSVGTNTALSSTDTILGAFQKVQGQLNNKMNGALISDTYIPFSISGALANSIITQVSSRININGYLTAGSSGGWLAEMGGGATSYIRLNDNASKAWNIVYSGSDLNIDRVDGGSISRMTFYGAGGVKFFSTVEGSTPTASTHFVTKGFADSTYLTAAGTGSLVQGSGISLTGTITNRLAGAGNVTIASADTWNSVMQRGNVSSAQAVISVGAAGSGFEYIKYQPTDWGTGKPYLSLGTIGGYNDRFRYLIYDGTTIGGGLLDIYVGTLTYRNEEVATRTWVLSQGYVTSSRSISAGTGLNGGGDLSINRTISFDTSWGDARYALRGVQINGVYSITGGGDLTSNRNLQLVNDSNSPGNNMLYGTNSSGVKGWYSQPSGGGGSSAYVYGSNSLTGGGDALAGTQYITLINDNSSPGANMLYGTNGSGTKGWYAQPSGGGGGVSGSGSSSYFSYWTGSTSLGSSPLYYNSSSGSYGERLGGRFGFAIQADKSNYPGIHVYDVSYSESPISSALMQMDSNTRGFLVPRMSRADRLDISSPATGLLVYQTDTVGGSVAGFKYYAASSWTHLETNNSKT